MRPTDNTRAERISNGTFSDEFDTHAATSPPWCVLFAGLITNGWKPHLTPVVSRMINHGRTLYLLLYQMILGYGVLRQFVSSPRLTTKETWTGLSQVRKQSLLRCWYVDVM